MYKKSIEEFNELLASNSPAPGGGGVCGLVGSLCACLSQMCVSISLDKPKLSQYQKNFEMAIERLKELNKQLLEAINQDKEAFLPVTEAYKLDKNTPNYHQIMDDALFKAGKSPLNILYLTCEVIDLNNFLKDKVSKLVISDIATSVILARSVLLAAYINVKVNTRLMSNQKLVYCLESDAVGKINKYVPKCDKIYKEILERLS